MAIVNGYCTLADAKDALGISDSSSDTTIENLITAASRMIDGYTERYFFTQSQTRIFQTRDPFTVAIDDLVSVTTLSTDDGADNTYSTTWSASDYLLDPPNAALESPAKPYTMVVSPVYSSKVFPMYVANGVKIVGVFGWPAVPEAVKQAAILQTTNLFSARNAPFGVIGMGDTGIFRMSSRLHPAAAALLEPYRRRRGLAG